jgi:hypothetical protein
MASEEIEYGYIEDGNASRYYLLINKKPVPVWVADALVPQLQEQKALISSEREAAVKSAKLDENAWSRQQMIARSAFGENDWAIKLFNDRKLKLLELQSENKEIKK